MGLDPKGRTKFKTSPEYRGFQQEKDLFRRRIFFTAFLADSLKKRGVDAILVGGEAVDLYTAGTFATSDIDLLVSNKAAAEKLLNRFGFGREGSGLWFNRDLNIIIQVISEPYSGDAGRLRRFRVKEYELRVAAPEDLIANRLYSAKFWKSNPQRDLEQAVTLLKIFSDSIDNSYLDGQARKNNIEDTLAEARKHA